MYELVNEDGINCARTSVFQKDGRAWAIVVSWNEGVDGLPDERAFHEAIDSSLDE